MAGEVLGTGGAISQHGKCNSVQNYPPVFAIFLTEICPIVFSNLLSLG